MGGQPGGFMPNLDPQQQQFYPSQMGGFQQPQVGFIPYPGNQPYQPQQQQFGGQNFEFPPQQPMYPYQPQPGCGFPHQHNQPQWLNPNQSVNTPTSNTFYPNGKKKYDSFWKRFYHPNDKPVYDDFHGSFFYANGEKAFDGFHSHVYYENGKQAYDGFWKRGYYDNGNQAGSDGIHLTASGVSMRLNGEVSDFQIALGNGFFALINLNGKQKSLKLFSDGNLVMLK